MTETTDPENDFEISAIATYQLSNSAVEKYIQSLTWSPEATDHEKTLVAGNIRGFAAKIRDKIMAVDAKVPPSQAQAYEFDSFTDRDVNP